MIPENILDNAASLLENGDRAAARDALTEGLLQFPEEPRILNNLAVLCLEEDSMDEAASLLSRAHNIAPDDHSIACNYGYALLSLGDTAEARNVFESVLKRKPDSIEALNHLALVDTIEGRYAEAVELFEKSLALAPTDVRLLNNYGATLRKTGRFAQALKVLEKARRLAPNDVEVLSNLGATLIRLHRFEDAEEHLNRAREIDPEDALLYYHLGCRFREEWVEARAEKPANRGHLSDLMLRAEENFRKYLEVSRDSLYADYVNAWLDELENARKAMV
ncbi:MAG: tetratricopeptide repeat protein [Candidatus Brocadiia bacterium]